MLKSKSKRKTKAKGMDLRLASSSSEKRKINKDQGVDIISTMPDCILQCIFFFLPIEDVFRTSILAKRWQHLWISLANLDLQYETYSKIRNMDDRKMLENSFLKFVDRALVLHDASVIKRLRLGLDFMPAEYSRLDSWISTAVEHNVEELEVCLGCRPQCELPCSLFTCRSLILLKIDSQLTLKAPSDTYLLNLKKLFLSEITFSDELSTQRLFSNCPALNELELVRCDWENIKNVTICLPSLRNLTIIGDADSYFSSDRYGDYITNSHVKIDAANLACLEFSTHLDVDFEFIGLSSLKTASLNLPYIVSIEEEIAKRAFRLVSWICNVEYLSLSGLTVECLGQEKFPLDQLPTFSYVTCLEVDEQIHHGCAAFLLEFLEKMPNLEYLELSEGYEEESCDDDDLVSLRYEIMQQTVPSCFKSSLRTFAVEFKDLPPERLMIDYVLKNATVLESLCISCSESLDKKRLSKFKRHLKKRKIHRGSKSCKVEFSY